jgi:hypothetical protein
MAVVKLKLSEAKRMFFDRPAIEDAVGKATAAAMRRGGTIIMRRARRLIKSALVMQRGRVAPGEKRKVKAVRVSKPGDPPFSRTGLLRDNILFVAERSGGSWSVKVGPILISRPTGAPDTLEFGGDVVTPDRSRERFLGGGGEIELGQGTNAKEVEPGVWVRYAKLRTPAQVARANAINRALYAPKRVRVAERPYMAPALEAAIESGKLPELWEGALGPR